MKQYIVITTNPDAGHPEWRADSYTFNSLVNAENSKRGTIEALQRGHKIASGGREFPNLKNRKWAIVEIDIEDIMNKRTFWSRVKTVFHDLGRRKIAKVVDMSEKEFRKAQALANKD